jgi:hypothetical protein
MEAVMKKVFGWVACLSLIMCLLGAVGCGEGAENGTGDATDTDVEVRDTPDLNPQTDDDVDVDVEDDAAAANSGDEAAAE